MHDVSDSALKKYSMAFVYIIILHIDGKLGQGLTIAQESSSKKNLFLVDMCKQGFTNYHHNPLNTYIYQPGMHTINPLAVTE